MRRTHRNQSLIISIAEPFSLWDNFYLIQKMSAKRMQIRGTKRLRNGHRCCSVSRRLIYRRVKINGTEPSVDCDARSVNTTTQRDSIQAGNHLTARFRTSIEWRITRFASRHADDRLPQEKVGEEMV